jgi:phosphate-selective porin OprO/OprP
MSINIRGLFFFDGAAFSQDGVDKQRYDEQNGLTSRVARLIVEGTGADIMSYKVEFEFARLYVEDLWLGISGLPHLGNIRIGHMKEPFSLEQIPTPKYNTFMERSLAEFIHTPPRRLGIMAFDTAAGERVTWAAGLFSDAPGTNFVQDDDFGGAFTSRVTWLPWYDEATQGRGLLHTGIAYSHRECFRSTVRFRARPESFLASYAIDTGNIPADRVDLLGTELALVYGPFSAQSEYILGMIDPIGAPEASIQGAYVLVSYFLTGESRNYLKSEAIFGRVKPFENFLRVRTEDGSVRSGKGAWELTYRYSYLDAWDGGKLSAGRIGNHGVGVNWYLNPFTRVMAEYVYSTINRPGRESDGHLHIFQVRTQIEF